MKKIFSLFILTLFLSGCSSRYKIVDYNPDLYWRTFSENNSQQNVVQTFDEFEIRKAKTITYKNQKVNELVFYGVNSSFNSRKIMYDNFNNWDKYQFIKYDRTPYLIWENVKLFKNSEEKYHVIAGGYECTTCKKSSKNIFTSIIVLDFKGNDCLSDKNPNLKNEIIKYFSNEIIKLKNDGDFYNKFWGLALKTKK